MIELIDSYRVIKTDGYKIISDPRLCARLLFGIGSAAGSSSRCELDAVLATGIFLMLNVRVIQ